ncbi:replication initiation and membrane attachment family protein [Sporosarcina sp. HYO08]|uniref:replication initiation and membrane attachment family protein n=1 Tax=Sporosarcina sp. HYO08 TaxID=1759557 RepID=UPI000798E5DB|nr:DnaD domain protein [Sporosarcina sp. HYO08]KXH87212.1 hypothetical protein AU377_01155 [Sporosarcina sp. HYO08]
MAALYKELQPVDVYKIRLSHPFSDYDRQLLTLFYQPLIGSQAMSLFMTLWADAEQPFKKEYTHYHLMNTLTLPLGPIFEARISLEAIGLMRTYQKTEGAIREFAYELLPPLDAKTFFADPLLSTFLFSKIGEQSYRNLRTRFMVNNEVEAGFNDISRTFLDVYKPVQVDFASMSNEPSQFVGKKASEGIPFEQNDFDFDFDLLRSGLSEQMVPQSALSSISNDLIARLAFLYSLTPLDMQKVIMMALDDQLQLPEERLRKAAAEFYKLHVSQEAPILHKVFQQTVPKMPERPVTREDELIFYLENTPPIEMLRDINGKEPLSVDVKLAEKLINTHGFSVGVVNVLLQYVYLRNDGKLTNNYVERIASHWMNKGINDARAALEISRREQDQYLKWKNEEQKKQPSRRKKTASREEKIPEWFYKKEQKPKDQAPASDPAIDQKRQELLKKMNALRNEVE